MNRRKLYEAIAKEQNWDKIFNGLVGLVLQKVLRTLGP